jgi:hypothetical protein
MPSPAEFPTSARYSFFLSESSLDPARGFDNAEMALKKDADATEHATDAEVEAAIRGLSEADGIRLLKVASFRARALSGLGLGVTADDLLQEAILRTVAGRRRWRKSVTFVKHLIKSLESIANHSHDELKGGVVVPATAEDADGRLDGLALKSRLPDGERVAAANEQLRSITKRFDNDDEVGLVLEGHANDMTGPEIQTDLKVNETQYETIMTRLRRGVDRKEGWRP